MDITCPKETSGLRWHCDMTGHWLTCPIHALAASHLVLLMPCPAPPVVSLQYDTTKSETLLLICSLRFAQTLRLSRSWLRCRRRYLHQPPPTRPSNARADIRARGLWTRAFLDVRVFHPDSPSYSTRPLDKLLVEHERRKKSEYAERIINVDRGTFTPLVFTTAGCCAPECSRFVKHLCGLISKGDKWYAETMTYLRCWLAFVLLRSATMCVRSARSSYHRSVNALLDLATGMREGNWIHIIKSP